MLDLIDVSQSKVVFGLRFTANDGGLTALSRLGGSFVESSSKGRHRLLENVLKRLNYKPMEGARGLNAVRQRNCQQ
jgi:hypothetical protein